MSFSTQTFLSLDDLPDKHLPFLSDEFMIRFYYPEIQIIKEPKIMIERDII